ncbi:archease [Desulfonema ishimotonii]|nr:archease [Desulfonema ishimotonii]
MTDHTADLGIRVFGQDLQALFADAAHALSDLITDVSRLDGSETREFHISGDDWPDLMVNWLREALYLWTGEEMLIRRAEVLSMSEYALHARVSCDPYAPDLHTIRHEIKAVTYHDIRVDRFSKGWEAQIIFDT